MIKKRQTEGKWKELEVEIEVCFQMMLLALLH